MSSEIVIGKRYARAIFELALEKGAIDQVGTELTQISNLIQSHEELAQLVENPAIDLGVKKNAFKQVLGANQYSEIVTNAVLYVLEKGREKALPAIVQAYAAISNEHAGRAVAVVTTPFPLSDTDSAEIAVRFGKVLNKAIQVQNEVDPSLLGGMKIRIGDTLYDGSLLSRLESMKKYLNEAKAM